MARPKVRKKTKEDSASGDPSYPYVIAPKSLRRFLDAAPGRPKPPRIVAPTLKTWGFRSGNDVSILRVLKTLGLLSPSNEPTQLYADYMRPGTGAAALGKAIKQCYEKLFQTITSPEKASNDELRSFFNINSGGSDRTIQLQVDTFKALASFATFGNNDPLDQEAGPGAGSTAITNHSTGFPTIRIDLHIHLPENKTKTDYDAILESIANHIYRNKQ